MTEQINKPIANVTINYQDGTQDTLEYFALVGLGGDVWYSVMRSPLHDRSKIKLNNMMVELSNEMLVSLNQK
jgi:hypothetical protein